MILAVSISRTLRIRRGHGKPTMFHMNFVNTSNGTSVQPKIHPSRIVAFRSNVKPTPIGVVTQEEFWGSGAVRAVIIAIKALEAQYASSEALMNMVRTARLFIPQLQSTKLTPEERQALIDSGNQIIESSNNLGLTILDASMKYETSEYPFTGVDALTEQFQKRVAALAQIPRVRLFSDYEGGLGSTGAGSRIQYHERLRTDRESYIAPPLRLLDYIIVRSALGKDAKPYVPVWNPLQEATPIEKSQILANTLNALASIRDTAGVEDDKIANAINQVLANSGFGET